MTLQALRILRAHGMGDTALQMIFQASVITKLLSASSAWWAFATSDDHQRIEGYIRRCSRAGRRSPDQPTANGFRTRC